MLTSAFHNKPLIFALDDDVDLLLLFQRTMTAKGFDTKIAATPEKFWDLFSRDIPQIIFLDIQMGAVHGGDICETLKSTANTAEVPVILLSANTDVEQIAEKCGANGFLRKPFTSEKVLGEISRILHHPQN